MGQDTKHRTGRHIYAPMPLLDEISTIQMTEQLPKKSDAIDKLVSYSILGREIIFRKKGTITDIIFIIIAVFVFAIAFLFIGYMTEIFQGALHNISMVNDSTIAIGALDHGLDTVQNKLDYVFFMVFIGMVVAMVITAWFIGGMPIFMFIYFILTVISVILSAVIANVWEDMNATAIFFSATKATLPLTNYVLTYLPVIMAIVGILGLIAMFAKPVMEGGW
jgi:hypothetical protein